MAISPRFAIRTFRIIVSIIYPAALASNDLIWILSVKLPIDYLQKKEVLPYSERGNLPMRPTLVVPMLFGTGSISMQKRSDATIKELNIEIEELEPKVAPNADGQLGYEGQPGNQGNGLLGYEGHPGNQGGH